MISGTIPFWKCMEAFISFFFFYINCIAKDGKVHVLDLENPDLWKWLSGQEKPPESVSSNPVFAAVHERVMNNLENHSSPETRATPGQPWVRGWDDIKKGRDGPIAGNQ